MGAVRAGIIITRFRRCFFILTSIGGSLGKGVLTLNRSLLDRLPGTKPSRDLSHRNVCRCWRSCNRRRKGFIYSLVQGRMAYRCPNRGRTNRRAAAYYRLARLFVFAAIPSLIIAFLARKLKETPQFEASREIARFATGRKRSRGSNFRSRAEYKLRRASSSPGSARYFEARHSGYPTIGGAFLAQLVRNPGFAVSRDERDHERHNVTFQNSLIVLCCRT